MGAVPGGLISSSPFPARPVHKKILTCSAIWFRKTELKNFDVTKTVTVILSRYICFDLVLLLLICER